MFVGLLPSSLTQTADPSAGVYVFNATSTDSDSVENLENLLSDGALMLVPAL